MKNQDIVKGFLIEIAFVFISFVICFNLKFNIISIISLVILNLLLLVYFALTKRKYISLGMVSFWGLVLVLMGVCKSLIH